MYKGAGMHGGFAGSEETISHDAVLPGAEYHRMPDERYSALPIVEISDKDYRSFCWPCHALEETSDCQ